MPLQIIPLSLAEANELVRRWHRHHKPTPGSKFAVGVADDGRICGAAIAGRPVSRMADDGWTIEVNRCVTDGTKNACSALYGACWRAARAMGYRRAITYTLPSEGGASLRGAGWSLVGEAGGGQWSRESRPRVESTTDQVKFQWMRCDAAAREEAGDA